MTRTPPRVWRAAAVLAPLLVAGAGPPLPAAHDALLYASNEKGNSVSVISAAANRVIATIPVGRRPRGLALSVDRSTVYVALGQDNAIGVIEVAAARMTGTFPADTDPELVALAPDRKTLYVSNEQIARTSAIDVLTHRIRYSTPVGAEAGGGGGVARRGQGLHHLGDRQHRHGPRRGERPRAPHDQGQR